MLGHGRLAVDLGPAFTRAARQRLRQVGGLDVAVLGVLDRADDPFDIAQRPDVLDLAGREELDLDADRLGDAGVVIVLVHPVAGAGEADVRHLPKAGVEARLLFEGLVERDGILMNLSDRVAQVEQRQQARRMPGRAGGQLLALDEHAVGPALPGEMVERRNADHAPADHHRPRMRSHWPPSAFRFPNRSTPGLRSTAPFLLSREKSRAYLPLSRSRIACALRQLLLEYCRPLLLRRRSRTSRRLSRSADTAVSASAPSLVRSAISIMATP